MTRVLAPALCLLAAGIARADPARDARAALALARALEAVRAETAPPATWKAARAQALATGKPVVVRVGTPAAADPTEARLAALYAQALAAELRPACLTTRLAAFAGDATPRYVLVIPQGGACWHTATWPEAPTPAAVRAAVAAGRRQLAAPPCACGPDCACPDCACADVQPVAPARPSCPPGGR